MYARDISYERPVRTRKKGSMVYVRDITYEGPVNEENRQCDVCKAHHL